MSRPLASTSVLLPLLLAGLLWSAGPEARAAPRGPQVHVRTLEQGAVAGVLVGLDGTTLRLREAGAAEDRALKLSGVIDVHLPGVGAAARGAAPAPESIRLKALLVGGESLTGLYRGPSEEGVQLEVHGMGTVVLPFEIILTLETVPAKASACHDLSHRCPRPESGDLAYDVGDDEFGGAVFEATAVDLVLEDARGRKRTLPWKRLRVVHLENTALETPDGLRAEIELVRGSRIATAGAVEMTGKGLGFALRSQPEKKWDVPFSAVRAVRWSGGSFVYATSLPFKSVYRKYYDDPPPVLYPGIYELFFGARVDRRASGCPLRIAGVTHRHGFGVNSFSSITIELRGGYRSFQVGFGIDDEVFDEEGAGEKRGNLEARVLGDGKVLWKASDARAGQPALRVGPLDVSGVKQLVLEVDFGKELMMLDRADWVDPILVRK